MTDAPSASGNDDLSFGYELYPRASGLIEVEVWPKSGSWSPFVVVVPVAERAKLNSAAYADRTRRTVDAHTTRRVDVDTGAHAGIGLHHSIDAQNSARIFLNATPSELQFGQVGRPLHVLRFGD